MDDVDAILEQEFQRTFRSQDRKLNKRLGWIALIGFIIMILGGPGLFAVNMILGQAIVRSLLISLSIFTVGAMVALTAGVVGLEAKKTFFERFISERSAQGDYIPDEALSDPTKYYENHLGNRL